jgi:CRISPR-associated protein Cmr6
MNDAAEDVPMMFRAQIQGRCQLQYAQSSDIHKWKSQWIDSAKPQLHNLDTPEQTEISQSNSYKISWRFVTNGGQDDGIIRPVIGARGLPYYPGSSMKGIFRKACTPEEGDLYCGKALPNGDFQPGILRFHGSHPTNDWTKNLIDIVHPQQGWQVKTTKTTKKPDGESAFTQISLYQPELKFRISSAAPLEPNEWKTVWQIWEKALSMGIGCRVSSGYGQPENHTGSLLYKVQIKGEGQAAKLLDGGAEFRPNIFRAALRGHALRIFGGLTDETTAETLVAILFGNIQKGNDRAGLLSMKFQPFPPTVSGSENPVIQMYGQGNYQVDTYKVEGELNWLLTQKLSETEQAILKELVKHLIQFAMIFGGFGKSWRRADHRLFYEEYYNNPKPMIGCHWQWLNEM